MSLSRSSVSRGLPTRSFSGLLCALGAALLLVNACKDEEEPPDYGVVQPPPPSEVGTENDGGTGGPDGGAFAAKPSCSSGSVSCAGACPDGGVVCASNCGFLSPVEYRFAGTTDPEDIEVGDLNGDGYNDIVTANSKGNSVSVLLNRKAGLFQQPSVLAAGTDPSSVLVADLNADKKLDIVVANRGDKAFGVYRGEGNGAFQTPVSSSFGMIVDDMALGQFGASGQSIAALRGFLEELSVIQVNADGTLQEGSSIDAPSGPDSMVVADFNRDGRLDVAVTHSPTCVPPSATCQSVGVFLGKGDGTFQPQILTATGGLPRGIVALDLDRDLIPDLVVADASRNQVLVLRGLGNGTFVTPVAYPAGNGAERLAVADINKDGVPDVLAANSTDNRVSLFPGRADGTLAPQVLLKADPRSSWLQGIVASDFDKDNAQDVAVLTDTGIQMLWGFCR